MGEYMKMITIILKVPDNHEKVVMNKVFEVFNQYELIGVSLEELKKGSTEFS